MKHPWKCAIVGYGYMGQIRHHVIEQNPRLMLAGIWDQNQAEGIVKKISARILSGT